MWQINFFDIPVYRITERKYYEQREKYISGNSTLEKNKEFYERNPDYKIRFIDHLENQFGGIWRYKEIIGYIRLYILGSQIRGEYFENNVKMHVKTRRKQFKFIIFKLAPEMDLPLRRNSKLIYEIIIEYFENCKKEIPDRYVDTTSFELIGLFFDWKQFLLMTEN